MSIPRLYAPDKPDGGRPVPETPPWAVGWVYLVGSSAGYQKLGFSGNPDRRLTEYTRLPFEVFPVHDFPVGHRNIETRLHAFFEPRRCRGEWYSLGARGVELFKTIRECRSTASLPVPFQSGRYVPQPGDAHASWSSTADRFGLQLAYLRMQLGVSVAQLADKSGVPPHQIRAYETGTSPHLSWHEVIRLADALGVCVSAFRGGHRP